MYYSDNKYNPNKVFKTDEYKLKSDVYIIPPNLKNEQLLLKNEQHIVKQNVKDMLLKYNAPLFVQPKSVYYTEDSYNTIQYGDMEFYNWLKTQSDPSIAILAEIVHSPKLNTTIEKVREKINTIDTISIDEYKKIKCLGSRQVQWLKELKKKYGNHILKFLQYSLL